MLARVLLHVIEPPRPIDIAVDVASSLHLTIQYVDDTAVLEIHDIEDARRTKGAGIERLTAGRRVKRRDIECYGGTAIHIDRVHNCRVEGRQIRIGVVQAGRRRHGLWALGVGRLLGSWRLGVGS